MKRFKVGFVAVIAILAMSFTVASKTNVLGNKLAKAAITEGCYTTVSVANTPYSQVPTGNPNGNPSQPAPIPNSPVTSTAAANHDPSEFCLLPQQTFCCYKVVSNGDGTFRVDQVFYKQNPS